MRKLSVITLLAVICLALGGVSCQSEKALELVNQEAAIEKYITSQCQGKDVVYNSGAARVTITPGTDPAKVVEKGDKVTMKADGFIFSNGPSTAFLSETITAVIGDGKLLKGLDSGLIGARCGEECYIIFSAKYGYYDEAVGIVPKMSPLLFQITVNNIEKQ